MAVLGLLFLGLFVVFIYCINAVGFKESCRFFNKNISFFESLIILINATISALFYEIIIGIIGLVIIVYYSMTWIVPLFKIAVVIAGAVGYFKSLKNNLEVGWISAILINILGNIISMLIIAGIIVFLYIIGWWFGGMEHTAGNIISNQIPSNNIGTI
jgi:hypothetical protein